MGCAAAVSHLRKERRRKLLLERCRERPDIPNPVDDHPIDSKELLQAIGTAIHTLPHWQRSVYVLNKEEGWSHHEIAETLQVSPLTVQTHMKEAKKRLREKIKVMHS